MLTLPSQELVACQKDMGLLICPEAPAPKWQELVTELPTLTANALQDKKLARELQCLFASPYLRVNTTTDVIGVEICGALKNVLALAAGEVPTSATVIEQPEAWHNSGLM